MNPVMSPARSTHSFGRALAVLLLTAFLLHLSMGASGQDKVGGQRLPNVGAPPTPETTTLFVRFTDDRIMKMGMGKEVIALITPYGKLLIPIAHIRSIDFATRIADADARRANAAVANLSSRRFRVRRAAEAELRNLRAKAAPALHQALRSDDVEVVLRAKNLLGKLSELVAEDQLEFRAQDVVRTAESRIAGRIDGTGLKAYPFPLDKGPRKVLPLMGLRSLAVGGDPREINAAPDPGNLQVFQGRIGKTFWFKVTGAVGGPIWGTKVYTSDSTVAVTAVHAGVLKVGQTGVVRVKIVESPNSFAGSTRNGVTSAAYGAWPGAYQFVR
jgi:hypothetical protein